MDTGLTRNIYKQLWGALNFSRVPKEQQLAFYCSASGQEDRASDILDYLLNEYSNPSTLFGRKQRLLKALACTKDTNKLKW